MKKEKKTYSPALPSVYFQYYIPNNLFKKKKEREKGRKREDRKTKGNVKTAVTLFNPKDISKFCFLCICNL